MPYQQTVASPIKLNGIGLHTGQPVNLTILPAQEDYGIVFERVDLPNNKIIPAHFNNVVNTNLSTVLGNKAGVTVATVEHLMSALWGCGVDNAHIKVNNIEVPAMDGSSLLFVKLIDQVGIQKQHKHRKIIKIIDEIEVVHNDQSIKITPNDGFVVDFTINYNNHVIGEQSLSFNEQTNNFNNEISNARTFGFVKDLKTLWANGLALGASTDNAIAISDNGVVNQDGLRHPDEFVRHKILDCIGDLYLAGARLHGYVSALKTGHTLHNKLLKKLFSKVEAYQYVIA
ncbi:UDP-3-O-acyl-N-acetylglucosamine deacetylase [Rickettsiales endosymbiont of Peranema trichophorum]|uniref:UDP-3-O-acyl-N-acetylglucosamine deacetylase n=1 Tax=Rickettsiales endosymbiont of Peranema trichophorum TaxID=2486577 RepID=UPI0013EED7F8|nr:UDP-3-O-acyl-N-acetylglucosamine deacetylase [Rickettsiales endosymbiont of Peranema trichophorum]